MRAMVGERRSGKVATQVAAVLLTAATVFSVLGCRDPSPTAPSGRLVLGTRTEPRSLDPAFVRRAGAQEIVRLLFRDLTDFDDRWQLRSGLAESLPQARTSSTGGWVVDWTLRSGLKWSDGRPLTTGDVVFGYRVEADARWAAVNYADAQRIDRIVARDDRHFSVFWKQPFATYRAPRVHAILPRHAYPEPRPAAAQAFAGQLEPRVSSGPFQLQKWVRGEQLVLTRNPHWAGPAPGLETIVFRFLRSADALEAELLAGTIDAVGEAGGLPPDRAIRLAERLRDTHEVVLTDAAIRVGIECRMDHPVVGRAEVRRALSAVIDRAALAKVAFGGAAGPALGLFPPRHPAYTEVRTVPGVAQARKSLSAFEGQAPIPLQFAADSAAARRGAVFLHNTWSKAGFPVVLDGQPFRVLLEKLAAREHGPLVLLALRMRPDWDGRSVLRKDGAQNYGGYRDPEVDAWIDAAAVSLDPATWRAKLLQVEARYQRDLPSIPLLYRRTASVRPRALQGWKPTGTTTPVTWNAEKWRWSQMEPRRK